MVKKLSACTHEILRNLGGDKSGRKSLVAGITADQENQVIAWATCDTSDLNYGVLNKREELQDSIQIACYFVAA